MSTFERMRQTYEDIEIYESAMMSQLEKKPKTTKQQVTQYHHISNLIDRIKAQSELIEKTSLKDEDGTFKEELESMKGQNAFGSFYNSLKETKDYHLRFPNTEIRHGPDIESEMKCSIEFSGEEMFGKYIDLHPFHERSINMKQLQPQFETQSQTTQSNDSNQDDNEDIVSNKKIDYVDYLSYFNKNFNKINLNYKKSNKKYNKYLIDLYEYLKDFYIRTSPLINYNELMNKNCLLPFEESWGKNEILGWESSQDKNGSSSSSTSSSTLRSIDLSKFNSPEELQALGMDRIAEGLGSLDMKSGGSLSERAKRLFSIKNIKDLKDIPKKLKNKKTSTQSSTSKNGENENATNGDVDNKRKRENATSSSSSDRDIALNEYKVMFLSSELGDVIDASKKHIEKKHTMLLEERVAEVLEEEAELQEEDGGDKGSDDGGGDSDDDKDEGVLYNPLNLPLGWDGKPIPYWLYKLHGLGVEFKCEICGNSSYFGRKAFDRHFQDFRHAYGMRCLGIPNTKHFHDITLIEDAVALYEKLKSTMTVEMFDAAAEEEYEDSEGHVLNRRTYEDLARQGLL